MLLSAIWRTGRNNDTIDSARAADGTPTGKLGTMSRRGFIGGLALTHIGLSGKLTRALGEDLAVSNAITSKPEEIDFSRFVSKNIEKLGPLSPPPFLSPPHVSAEVAAQAQAHAQEKLNNIRLVWEASNRAEREGLIAANSLGIANYTNLETLRFLEELEAASKRPDYKRLPDYEMRKLLGIGSTNIIAALLSFYQQGLLSPEELLPIIRKLEMKNFHAQTWLPWNGKFNTLEFTLLEETIRNIAENKGLRPAEILEEPLIVFDKNDDDLKYENRPTDAERLRKIVILCNHLGVDVSQLIRTTKDNKSYASITFSDMSVASNAENRDQKN